MRGQYSTFNIKDSGIKAILFFTFYFLLFTFSSFAQTISVTTDREKILLGEQITADIKIEDLNAQTAFISTWYSFPDTINHIEVINRSAIDTVEVNGLTSYLQKIIITSFDSGRWQLPQLQITLQDKNTGKKFQVKSNTAFMEVLPVDVSAMKNYHHIKDIILVKPQPVSWVLIILIVTSIFILIVITRWLINRNKKNTGRPKKKMIHESAFKNAIMALNNLQKSSYYSAAEIKSFYIQIDEICRTYFDAEFDLKSFQSTADEMMIYLKDFLTEDAIRTSFYQLVRLTDAVKFAKYLPDKTHQLKSIDTAKSTVEYLNKISAKMRMPHA